MEPIFRLIVDPGELVVADLWLGLVAAVDRHTLQEVARFAEALLAICRVAPIFVLQRDLVLLLLANLIAIAGVPVPRENDRRAIERLVEVALDRKPPPRGSR